MERDPNTEVFQSRAEMVKQENCAKQWHERWYWLIEEQSKALKESQEARSQRTVLPGESDQSKAPPPKRHPVPRTTTGFIGWLSAQKDCQLEVYTGWRVRIPVRLPDAWEKPGYKGTDS